MVVKSFPEKGLIDFECFSFTLWSERRERSNAREWRHRLSADLDVLVDGLEVVLPPLTRLGARPLVLLESLDPRGEEVGVEHKGRVVKYAVGGREEGIDRLKVRINQSIFNQTASEAFPNTPYI